METLSYERNKLSRVEKSLTLVPTICLQISTCCCCSSVCHAPRALSQLSASTWDSGTCASLGKSVFEDQDGTIHVKIYEVPHRNSETANIDEVNFYFVFFFAFRRRVRSPCWPKTGHSQICVPSSDASISWCTRHKSKFGILLFNLRYHTFRETGTERCPAHAPPSAFGYTSWRSDWYASIKVIVDI